MTGPVRLVAAALVLATSTLAEPPLATDQPLGMDG